MRTSLKVLLFGVALPGALSPALYAAFGGRHEPEHRVRVHVREVPPVPPVPDIEARVRADAERAVEQAEAVVRLRVRDLAIQGGDRCEVTVRRDLQLDAGQGDRLNIDAGPGELDVQGVQGSGQVRVVATLCASDRGALDGLDVSLDRRGDRIDLETAYPGSGDSWNGRYARIDLRVEVPRGMSADVRDTSGGIRLAGVGSVGIDDSSGSIEVVGADGDVRIDDSSGGIEVRDVAGDVDVADGSGGIDIADVQGSVRLTDGSGSIQVAEVDRDVRVLRDGSGSIQVREVEGDFVVERDGSGGIRYTGVKGRVEVPEKH